ncbi:MAG: type III-A CRISPR-associated RAMP protein Csm4 [Chloroflexi bacterium]|nr:type III-A CRISPR-associated RAMP protein Csm4 [Chloroflexota bacterium]
MPTFEVYRLRLRGPLRVGERGVGLEGSTPTVPSDTLFSALCMAMRWQLGVGWLEEWLAAYRDGRPPLLLSSTFPYVAAVDGQGEEIKETSTWLCWPRPRLLLARDPSRKAGGDGPDHKRVKKIRWVGERLFRRILAGAPTLHELDDGAVWDPEGVWWPQADRPTPQRDDRPLWGSPEAVPRVALDRLSTRSNLFRTARMAYRAAGAFQAGLFFLVAWRDEQWREMFDASLLALSELGLGSERSVGYGQFELVDKEPPSITFPDDGLHAVLLSSYHPTPEEVDRDVLDDAQIELHVRRGWVTSPEGSGWRRRSVHMLAPGSVVRRVGDPLGHLVDVTPPGFDAHPVYRCGYGLAVPCVAPQEVEAREEDEG